MQYAHTLPERPEADWETLQTHLQNVAHRAQTFAAAFDAGEWGRVAGVLHDVGKHSQAFQDYLRLSAAGEARQKGPDHSTAGAQWAAKQLGPGLGRLLAYVLAGHHSGLPDGFTKLQARLGKTVEPWQEQAADHLSNISGLEPPGVLRRADTGFKRMLFIRMLFSCLVDADSLCTEAFTSPDKAAWRQGYLPLAEMRARLDAYLAALAGDAPDTKVNRLRAEILAACRARASETPGLFSLTVPTGGGKTLSSLAFALDHALAHGLERVIYVIPYTSIIEQNAAVFRRALEQRDDEAVLEHHSNFEPPRREEDEDGEGEEHSRARLAAENWDAPLVVTTNVQFFESLFASRRSPCRKLHNIARSVVVLDEAQMLPPDYLLPCIETLRELCAGYCASVVLCTATQPALHRRDDFRKGLEGVREIAPDPARLYAELKRVRVTDLGGLDDAALAVRMAGHAQALCVVNTRKHARELYERMAKEDGTFHLSANMCPAHRTQKLDAIRQRLKEKLPCRVISTQLVEAGVDLNFPVVYRATAGLDSLAQAAGRCNREGKLEQGEVFLFRPEAGLPQFVKLAVEAAGEALRRHGDDPLSLAATRAYFEEFYWRKGDKLDGKGLLPLIQEGASLLNFPFPEVARLFRIIDEFTVPLVIPWDDEARRVIAALEHADSPARHLRRAQRYTVSVHPRLRGALVGAGAARFVTEECAVLENTALYRDDLGLCPDDPAVREAEGLIF